MTFSTQNYPNAPYTYNDPRILYNERCFFYNGGFDLVCLVGARKKIGVSTYAQQAYPQPQTLNLIFKTCIEYINDDNFNNEQYCEIKKYSYKDVKSDLKIQIKDLAVKRKTIRISSDNISINKTDNSSNANNSYISSSIKLIEPRKININSSIVKNIKK